MPSDDDMVSAAVLAAGTALPPILTSVPDARKAGVPLFDPVFFGYLAFLLGPLIATIAALWNAIALRRPRLAISTAGAGFAGWLALISVLSVLLERGWIGVAGFLLVARLLFIIAGVALASIHWPHSRGHQFLGGRVIPLLYSVIATFVLQLVIPWRWVVALWGLPGQ